LVVLAVGVRLGGALRRVPCEPQLLQVRVRCGYHLEILIKVEWQGGRVYLHLGARRDDPPPR
jgi:hypothetical protein